MFDNGCDINAALPSKKAVTNYFRPNEQCNFCYIKNMRNHVDKYPASIVLCFGENEGHVNSNCIKVL